MEKNQQRIPQFESLHILRQAMLCDVRDRAFAGLPLLYQDYSDGIISGCRMMTTKETITVQPGMVKHAGFIYYLQEPMTIDYHPTDEYMVLKLVFTAPTEQQGAKVYALDLALTDELELTPDEMELCRFKLKHGSILRVNYTDFFDRTTEFDTVNTIYAPYAGRGQSTLAPDIVKAFAKEASKYSLTDFDRQFCLTALAGQLLSAESIGFYISQRLQQEEQAWDNASLFDGLTRVLDEIRPAGLRECRRERRRRREVFVD
ncbi:MAG: hypothetical protein K6F01_09085 [Selenomonas sp.]|uniref:hypothetical protein n=1 Tax=Selenomonas sp. TaxID=2053611 RepID=UPI0025FEAD7F|nr:hypothetical protein [Selenomonas sp.]MCR5439568.1 hypothetical protein [Selenomonas sp.]